MEITVAVVAILLLIWWLVRRYHADREYERSIEGMTASERVATRADTTPRMLRCQTCGHTQPDLGLWDPCESCGGNDLA